MEKQKTTQTAPENKSLAEKKRGQDIGVIILNFFLAIVTVLLLGYIAYRNGYINLDNVLNTQEGQAEEEKEEEAQTDEVEDVEVPSEDEEPLVLETYEGEYVSAITPMDWEVVEYYDGTGSEMIDEGTTYTGLTGLEILNNGDVVMKIEAVSGIGFVGCRELPRFADSSTEYEERQEELNGEIADEEIEYLDYTDTRYSEFQWLGKRVRRIDTALYYDTVEDDDYFQPQCEVSFFRIEDLGFEMDGEYTGDTYMYTISQETTEKELAVLDQILTSMTAN